LPRDGGIAGFKEEGRYVDVCKNHKLNGMRSFKGWTNLPGTRLRKGEKKLFFTRKSENPNGGGWAGLFGFKGRPGSCSQDHGALSRVELLSWVLRGRRLGLGGGQFFKTSVFSTVFSGAGSFGICCDAFFGGSGPGAGRVSMEPASSSFRGTQQRDCRVALGMKENAFFGGLRYQPFGHGDIFMFFLQLQGNNRDC